MSFSNPKLYATAFFFSVMGMFMKLLPQNIPSTQTSKSLSIPRLSGQKSPFHARFLVLTEEKILHAAGNTLRIMKLREKNKNEAPNANILENDIDSTAERLPISEIFAEAEEHRGFSCFCHNTYRKLVAFSPRSSSPSLYIKALNATTSQEVICKIDNGDANLPYQDICFNKEGSRIAAIGENDTLYVWDIERKYNWENSRETDGSNQFVSTLIATSKFDRPLTTCSFDPSNDDLVSILSRDRRRIMKCTLKKTLETLSDVKIATISLEQNSVASNVHITSMIWEGNSRLLLGTSSGSIYLIECLTSNKLRLIFDSEPNDVDSIQTMSLTMTNIIVGFAGGKMVWISRPTGREYTIKNKIVAEINLDSGGILNAVNTPDFDYHFVYTATGKMHYFSTSPDRIEEQQDSCIARFPEGVITTMTTCILSGKEEIPILITGGMNGNIMAWKEVDIAENVTKMCSMFGSIILRAPVISMESLTGHPVIAVGLSNGTIHFIHIRRALSENSEENRQFEGLDLTVLKSELLCESPITALCFNPATNKLVAGCFYSGEIFVFCVLPGNLHVRGVIKIKGEGLSSLHWSCTQPYNLLVGTTYGSISCFDTSLMNFEPYYLQSLWTDEIASDGAVKISACSNPSSADNCTDVLICTEMGNVDLVHMTEGDSRYSGNRTKCVTTQGGQQTVVLSSDDYTVCGTTEGKVQFIQRLDCSVQCSKLQGGAILAMCFSSNKSRIFTSAVDGSMFVQHFRETKSRIASSDDYDYLLPRKHSKLAVSMKELLSDNRMTWIRRARKDTCNAGTNVPSIEKNDDGEHRLDNKTKNPSKLDQPGENQTLGIAIEDGCIENSPLEDKSLELIVQNVYKTYEISGDPKFAVYSIPERPLSEGENKREKKLVKLRQNEISKGENESVDCQLLATSTLSQEDKFIFDLIPKRSEKLDIQNNFDEEDSSKYPEMLLYPPSAVRTDQQRTIQIILLRQISRYMSGSFNKAYLALRSEKLNVLDYIRRSKNEIDSICREFDCNLNTDRFKLVLGGDIDIVPITLREQACQNGNNNNEIMKDTEIVDCNADNDWHCDEPVEEIDRLDKLSKLFLSIHERISVFNLKLIDMAKERLSVKKVLTCNELYCSALERGAFMSQVNIKKQEEVLQKLRKVEKKKEKVNSQLEAATILCEELKSKIDEKTKEYRLLDTHFSKSIRKYSTDPLDQETVQILYQHFIRRDINKTISFGDGDCFVSSNDPLWEGQNEHSNTSTSSPTADGMPEGSDRTRAWEGMIILRKGQIIKERELAVLRKELEKNKDLLDASISEEHGLIKTILHLQEELETLNMVQLKPPMPPEFITSLQFEPGLTEEEQKRTSCSNIFVVPTQVARLERNKVMKYNKKSFELQKTIQNLKNAVEQKKAQNKCIESRLEEAKGMFTNCRSLRATSPVRRKLNGMEPKDKKKLEQKAKNLTFKLKTAHDNKIGRLAQEKNKIETSIEKKRVENEKLTRQMAALKKSVEQYDEEASLTSESAAQIKMKQIMHQSRQMHTLRTQVAEISKLEDELKRLREKSFPSFSKFPKR